MEERLQKILSARGVASRRKAEELIEKGLVTVNGATVSLGDAADPQRDIILVDGRPLPGPEKLVYILLHKPRGYVTTLSDEKGRPNAAQLVSGCGVRVYPVGRLDMDSEGLLLFTNDGAFANRVAHPSHQVEKDYEVWVTGYQSGREDLLRRPVVLDGYAIRPPKVTLVNVRGDRALFRVTIHEGRNRQVRRMCQVAGLRCIRLKRIREGSLALGDLAAGQWRYLSEDEVRSLIGSAE